MTVYAQHVSTRQTPQTEKIPGTNQVANSAGGFAFPVDDWTRLDRFLILGGEGGTYYATERKLTQENAACVSRCLAADGQRTVNRIVEISDSGRAPKNDPAIFALAMAASAKDAPATRAAALVALPKVCRIGTHLFQFAESVQALRGWGRGLRRAIGDWYTSKDAGSLAYQVTKYQQRNGWSHRDLLRLAHPRASGLTQDVLYWAVKGWEGVGDDPHPEQAMLPIWAMERAKRATTKAEVVRLIREFNIVRECIPTQWLTEADVWGALLERMPLTAMIRNLATMTRVGLLAPMSSATDKVLAELANVERMRNSRLHPIALLVALKSYSAGRGEKGKNTWTPIPQIVDALDGAFYTAFGNVEPTGKRWMLALDVSGSMSMGRIAGIAGLTPRVASAALALVTANVERQHHFVAFTTGGYQNPACGQSQWASGGYSNGISPLAISPRQRLDDVIDSISSLPFGGTDCALPMLYASDRKIPVDAFVIVTDNETWAGKIHPCQALRDYRNRMGIGAKLIVCGMTATEFSIADKDDAGSMDVVGFDASTPSIMAEFVRG